MESFPTSCFHLSLTTCLRLCRTLSRISCVLCDSQARAPNSAVLVVGTHLDLIDTKFRTERLATLRAYILAVCRSPSGARASGYPDITWKHLQ